MATKIKEERTIMYSFRENGDVIVHKLPYDASNQYSREKLKKFEARGFTFDDPRKGKGVAVPDVMDTGEVEESPAEDKAEEPQFSEAEIRDEKSEALLIPCPECGRECKGLFGLQVHRRVHKKE